jgi:hypothetical protein
MAKKQVHSRIKKYARQISSRTKYPIKSIDQLLKALGGDKAVIQFERTRTPAKALRRVISSRFFPVASEEDLLKKSEGLRAKHMRK